MSFCENCCPFEERRTFAEAGGTVMRPSCEEEARRVYSMPATKKVSTRLSNAKPRVEKSAYEPGIVRQPEGDALPGKRHKPNYGDTTSTNLLR